MAIAAPHPNFFIDEMWTYSPDQAIADDSASQAAIHHTTLAVFPFRPLEAVTDPATAASTLPPVALAKVETGAQIMEPGVLDGHVDQSQYSLIPDNDWASACIDYDAPSPNSISSDTTGPMTPTITSEGSFTDHFFRSGSHLHNSVALDYAQRLAVDCKPVMPHILAPASTHQHVADMHHYPARGAPSYYSLPALPFDNAVAHVTQPYHAHPPVAHALRSRSIAAQDPNDLIHPASLQTYRSQQPLHCDDSTSVEGEDATVSPASEEASEEALSPPSTGTAIAEITRRQSRDRFLVEMREQGLSYREIKQLGHFREAESTLRGRWRNLTKEKHERVRKPEWTSRDVMLLRGAISKYSAEQRSSARSRSARLRIPWKKVSDQIEKDGGSYNFAPATCAKKWDDLGGGA